MCLRNFETIRLSQLFRYGTIYKQTISKQQEHKSNQRNATQRHF